MFILTGSKQSGTALWMQILIAAGYPPFGEDVALESAQRPSDANADRRFEASLRHGINFTTNPSPTTGQYVFPEQLARHVAEIFPFGVARTERAYVGKVVATLRPLREYVHAMRRLHALEDVTREAPEPARLDPSLEWWAENYALVRDASIRRYPIRFETVDRLLRDPEQVISDVVGWLGAGDAVRAANVVKPERPTFDVANDVSLPADLVVLCDELYAALGRNHAVTGSLLAELNAAQGALLPVLRAEDARLMRARASARAG